MGHKASHLEHKQFASLWKRNTGEPRKTVRFRIPEDMADNLVAIAQIIDKHPDRAIALSKLLELAKTL